MPFKKTSIRRQSLGTLVDQSTVWLMVTIGSGIFILALLILFHQNSNATKGYHLRNLERERSDLLRQIEVLKMQISVAQSLKKLDSDRQIQNMVEVRNPKYIQ